MYYPGSGLSGSGFKVQGLATPISQLKRSYKEFSNWMVTAPVYKQTVMSCN